MICVRTYTFVMFLDNENLFSEVSTDVYTKTGKVFFHDDRIINFMYFFLFSHCIDRDEWFMDNFCKLRNSQFFFYCWFAWTIHILTPNVIEPFKIHSLLDYFHEIFLLHSCTKGRPQNQKFFSPEPIVVFAKSTHESYATVVS